MWIARLVFLVRWLSQCLPYRQEFDSQNACEKVHRGGGGEDEDKELKERGGGGERILA